MDTDDHSRTRFWHDGTLTDIGCSACYMFLPMKEQHNAAIPFFSIVCLGQDVAFPCVLSRQGYPTVRWLSDIQISKMWFFVHLKGTFWLHQTWWKQWLEQFPEKGVRMKHLTHVLFGAKWFCQIWMHRPGLTRLEFAECPKLRLLILRHWLTNTFSTCDTVPLQGKEFQVFVSKRQMFAEVICNFR